VLRRIAVASEGSVLPDQYHIYIYTPVFTMIEESSKWCPTRFVCSFHNTEASILASVAVTSLVLMLPDATGVPSMTVRESLSNDAHFLKYMAKQLSQY
jgi:hypothetical protein